MRLPALLSLLSAFSAIAGAKPVHLNTLNARDSEPTPDQIKDKHYWEDQAKKDNRVLCYVEPAGDGKDDGVQIQDTLRKQCQKNSLVVFPGKTYNIKTIMNTMDLKNVRIEQFGRFLWSTDIDYWLKVTLPVGFQNQSTAWYFGGDNINWDGHNTGTFDGNGQVWYDWAKGRGNLSRRPITINWRSFTNSKVQRLRFVQTQMWAMVTQYAHNLEFDDIYINSTSNSQWSTLNTDGVDTINSDNITFRRWKVTNGDDCIALKGNSTNIKVYDSEFWHGQGFAIGSLAQYNGIHELVDNFYAKNTTFHNTTYAIYVKTWAGDSVGYPPNGGGGGVGQARNIVLDGAKLDNCRGKVFFTWQCENYSGLSGKNCNSSRFHMDDMTFKDVSGTVKAGQELAASFGCSTAAGGCHNITVENFSVKAEGNSSTLSTWACANVHNAKGFQCNRGV